MTIHDAVSSRNRTEIINLVNNDKKVLESSFTANESGEFYTPLCLAVKNGDIETVNLLVQLGAGVNNIGGWQGTPLHYAIWASGIDKITIIGFLLNNGANINAKNSNGETPLHIAVANGRLEDVTFLVKKGANVNIKSNNGESPLTIAETPMFRFEEHQAIANFLKKHGAKTSKELKQ